MRSPCVLGRLHRRGWRKAGGRGETRRRSLAEKGKGGNTHVPLKGRLPNSAEERLDAEDREEVKLARQAENREGKLLNVSVNWETGCMPNRRLLSKRRT